MSIASRFVPKIQEENQKFRYRELLEGVLYLKYKKKSKFLGTKRQ